MQRPLNGAFTNCSREERRKPSASGHPPEAFFRPSFVALELGTSGNSANLFCAPGSFLCPLKPEQQTSRPQSRPTAGPLYFSRFRTAGPPVALAGDRYWPDPLWPILNFAVA